MEVSFDIIAFSIFQQLEKFQWEIVVNVFEDIVKDFEEFGVNFCLINFKSEKIKEKYQE